MCKIGENSFHVFGLKNTQLYRIVLLLLEMFRKAERCQVCHLLLVGFARADYRGQPGRRRQLNQDVEFCGSGQKRGFQTLP